MPRISYLYLTVAVALTCLLSGCNAILSRDYLVISPHLEQHVDREIGDELRADNYNGLKSAILFLIENSMEEGQIRLYNYSGDADSDVRDACSSTTNNEPIGVYAVEYMSFECVRILTYYEVTINITYRRSPEQISSVIPISNSAEFRELFEDAFLTYNQTFTAEIQYYNENQYNINEILEKLYYTNPLRVLEIPSLSVSIYPDTGWRRIIEVKLAYEHDPLELEEMSAELTARTRELLNSIQNLSTIDKLDAFNNILLTGTNYIPSSEDDLDVSVVRDTSFTAYGALVERAANSSGYALALKALCDVSNIECEVVRGRYGSFNHWWNIVDADDIGRYHIDVALNDSSSDKNFFLLTDAEMSETHKWNTSSYQPTSTESITQAEEEPEPDTAPTD